MVEPKRRFIYLNGEDTGLSAYSVGEAASKLAMVLRRRGDLTVTAEALRKTHQPQARFTWPPNAEHPDAR